MPKLRDANLVYNPNSEFGANKTLATISLSNMANGSLNPDVASNIIYSGKEAKAKTYSTQFISGLEQIKLLFLSIITYQKQGVRDLVNTYGIDNPIIQPLIQDYADEPIQLPHDINKPPKKRFNIPLENLNPNRVVGSGRPKGSKNRPKNISGIPDIRDIMASTSSNSMWGTMGTEADMTSPQLNQQNLQGALPASRFSPNIQGAPLPSVATTSISSRPNPSNSVHSVHSANSGNQSDSDSESDNESVSSQGSVATGNMMGNLFNSPDPSDDEFEEDEPIFGPNIKLPKKLPIADAIIKASSMVEKVNVYFLGKLKPIFNYLDQLEIDKIIQVIGETNNDFNHINHVYIADIVENGDMVYDVLRTRFKKLILDVYISYKGYAPPVPSFSIPTLGSNIPRFKETPKPFNDSIKTGAGMTDRFIPTHFNKNIRSIPTKYLL